MAPTVHSTLPQRSYVVYNYQPRLRVVGFFADEFGAVFLVPDFFAGVGVIGMTTCGCLIGCFVVGLDAFVFGPFQ